MPPPGLGNKIRKLRSELRGRHPFFMLLRLGNYRTLFGDRKRGFKMPQTNGRLERYTLSISKMSSSKSYHKHPSHFPRQDCSPLCSLKDREEKKPCPQERRASAGLPCSPERTPWKQEWFQIFKNKNKQFCFPRTSLCSVTVILCIRTKTQAGWHLIVHFFLLFSNFASFLARECLNTPCMSV